jgi:hypothetical protein
LQKNPQEEPFSEAHLGSPEYRERLMRKLNCLIAVLEVATAKVKKSMAGAPKDIERLARICANLQSTLEVCVRARQALLRRHASKVEAEEPQGTAAIVPVPAPVQGPRPPAAKRPVPRGSDISNEAERKRFAALPPIDPHTISRCDLDDLAKRLTS